MEFQELMEKRRSVRGFTEDSIPAEALREILYAGLRAPNACNLQSWHFYCLCDRAKIAGLVPRVYGGEWMKTASCVIALCVKPARLVERFGERGGMFAIQDTAAAAENMLLRAADLGYGGCWVGAFDEDACREALGIPGDERPVILLPLGVPASEPPLRDRLPLEDTVTFIGNPGEIPQHDRTDKPFELRSAYLPNAVFDDLYLGGASFNNICLTDAAFTDANLSGASIRGCSLKGLTIEDCCTDGLTVNGVNVDDLMKRP
ncbi:MAG: nitroreductase family protein [Christensenellaceae bacterium]|nr:nitroreductase family protein [Christensenellaceae bacterium]